MRVLMVNHSAVVDVNRALLRALAADPQIELLTLCPSQWTDREVRVTYRPKPTPDDSGYQLIDAPARMTFHPALWFFFPCPVKLVHDFQPDLIHLNQEPYSLVAWQFGRLARKLRCPLVLSSLQNISKKYPFPFGTIEYHTLRQAAALVCHNAEAAAILRRKGARGPCEVVPLGYDETLYCRAPEGEISSLREHRGIQGFCVGYVGRLVPEKGVDLLIEAVAQLKQPATLVLIGAGPEEATLAHQALKRQVKTVMVGQVPHHDMPLYLSALDVLVLPSRTGQRWKEQFGRVLVEAMACGTPVIGSDSGEIPNVIGDAGLIFHENDVAALKDHLETLLSDPEKRKDLAQRGLERAQTEFTWGSIAQRMRAIYREVLR